MKQTSPDLILGKWWGQAPDPGRQTQGPMLSTISSPVRCELQDIFQVSHFLRSGVGYGSRPLWPMPFTLYCVMLMPFPSLKIPLATNMVPFPDVKTLHYLALTKLPAFTSHCVCLSAQPMCHPTPSRARFLFHIPSQRCPVHESPACAFMNSVKLSHETQMFPYSEAKLSQLLQNHLLQGDVR